MIHLLLKPGGVLERHKWNSDTQIYDIEDVSDSAVWHLNDHVQFDDGVVFRDLFILINQNMNLFLPIFGNWIDAYTDVVLNGAPELEDPDDNVPLHFLELYWNFSIDLKNDKEFSVPAWPNLHGVGFTKTDDKDYKKGELVNYGIGYSPMQKMANKPLKLRPDLNLYLTKNYNKVGNYNFKTESYTLYQVIQGVMYEISFHGSPTDTKNFMDYLADQVERIDSGLEKTYPMSEVMDMLNNKYKEDNP